MLNAPALERAVGCQAAHTALYAARLQRLYGGLTEEFTHAPGATRAVKGGGTAAACYGP